MPFGIIMTSLHYVMINGEDYKSHYNAMQHRLYTANVNRQTTDKLLFSDAIITDENM